MEDRSMFYYILQYLCPLFSWAGGRVLTFGQPEVIAPLCFLPSLFVILNPEHSAVWLLLSIIDSVSVVLMSERRGRNPLFLCPT